MGLGCPKIAVQDFLDASNGAESYNFEMNKWKYTEMAKRHQNIVGQICILDIDVQGVKAIKECEEFSPKFVFIKPPSLEALEQRLRDR